ncbi:L,D-transpeptidase family protein [Sulfuriroseicoccus oceanibius]|uniref:L,D-transpeptidase family protein n=1 Tax=Sulfuriroseicoccus oceanibius TaxID=2707525 RepID=A0A6B3LAK7_9BACT|nr:L,D-transpeptidase family protein [Sulfuriroseicoccus oceanibius]QQL45017.1 L,D-transpeptidase family protein [Sulfuriroseicoccus oceanibius]
MILRTLLILLILPAWSDARSPVPDNCRQLVVAIAPNSSSSHARLAVAERPRGGGPWQWVSSPSPVRLGHAGLAWGLGLHPIPRGAHLKKEGDGKAPCGAFAIGPAYGTLAPASVKRRPNMRYTRIGEGDLWVEDSSSPHYNRHLKLPNDRPAQSDWEKKQQMKLNDNAHKLKVFIAHNAPPKVVPNAGSAIFFHIWRNGGKRATSGCTVMPEARLRQLIQWLDPKARPVYVLLTAEDYRRLQKQWNLPDPF